MLPITASLICVAAALLAAAYSMLRWRGVELLQRQFLLRLTTLQNQLNATRDELERLEAAIAIKRPSATRSSPLDLLDQIEQLGESVSPDNRTALKETADQVAKIPNGVAADLFAADRKLLAIVRLIEKGHSLPDISRRLNLPLGEVELLVSLRAG